MAPGDRRTVDRWSPRHAGAEVARAARITPPVGVSRARHGRVPHRAMARLPAMPARRVASLVALTVATLLAATPSASAAPAALPKPDHVLVVVMENKDTGEILGSKAAPYLNALAAGGASFTDAHAETHPSQPNYSRCSPAAPRASPTTAATTASSAANLGSELIAAGQPSSGYAEGLPAAGSTVCTAGRYARKHSPWVNFRTCPRHRQPARVGTGHRLGPAADGRVPHARPVPRHARLPGRRRRRMGQADFGQLHGLGPDPQQPAR